MGRNASLDDFGPGGTTVEPITPVHRFFPEGTGCPDCGETVAELWNLKGTWRCATCRDW